MDLDYILGILLVSASPKSKMWKRTEKKSPHLNQIQLIFSISVCIWVTSLRENSTFRGRKCSSGIKRSSNPELPRCGPTHPPALAMTEGLLGAQRSQGCLQMFGINSAHGRSGERLCWLWLPAQVSTHENVPVACCPPHPPTPGSRRPQRGRWGGWGGGTSVGLGEEIHSLFQPLCPVHTDTLWFVFKHHVKWQVLII